MVDIASLLSSGVAFVLRGGDAAEVIDRGLSLAAAGAVVLEVTWTVPEAATVLQELQSRTDAVVGMGTVVSPDDAVAAVEAGARFLVTPGFHRPTIDAAMASSQAVLPGVATPGEVMAALALGLRTLKLFPSHDGPEHLGRLSGPFPEVRWVPSGGIGPGNVGPWFDAGAYAVAVGSEVTALPDDELSGAVAAMYAAADRRPTS